MLERTSGATAADSLARRRPYDSGEVAQVQGASGEGRGVLDLLTRKTDACAPTRYRPRIACEGQLHISVAGYQTGGEGTRVSRVHVSAAGRGTMANLSPYPGPLAHGNRHTFRRLPCRRCLYLQSPTAVAFQPTRERPLACCCCCVCCVCCRSCCFCRGCCYDCCCCCTPLFPFLLLFPRSFRPPLIPF